MADFELGWVQPFPEDFIELKKEHETLEISFDNYSNSSEATIGFISNLRRIPKCFMMYGIKISSDAQTFTATVKIVGNSDGYVYAQKTIDESDNWIFFYPYDGEGTYKINVAVTNGWVNKIAGLGLKIKVFDYGYRDYGTIQVDIDDSLNPSGADGILQNLYFISYPTEVSSLQANFRLMVGEEYESEVELDNIYELVYATDFEDEDLSGWDGNNISIVDEGFNSRKRIHSYVFGDGEYTVEIKREIEYFTGDRIIIDFYTSESYGSGTSVDSRWFRIGESEISRGNYSDYTKVVIIVDITGINSLNYTIYINDTYFKSGSITFSQLFIGIGSNGSSGSTETSKQICIDNFAVYKVSPSKIKIQTTTPQIKAQIVNVQKKFNDSAIDQLPSDVFEQADLIFRVSITGLTNLDNSGGGSWSRYIKIPVTTQPTEDCQYKIVIDDTNLTIYNSEGTTAKAQAAVADDFWQNVWIDGRDIRLFDQNGNQMYFWVEEFDYANKSATIWFKLTPTITELNIAYGNPSATKSGYENGEQVFEFFDDFNYPAGDLDGVNGWQDCGDINAQCNGDGTVTITSSSSFVKIVNSKEIDITDWIIEYRGRFPTSPSGSDDAGVVWKSDYLTSGSEDLAFYYRKSEDRCEFERHTSMPGDEGSDKLIVSSGISMDNDYHIYKIIYTSSNKQATAYVDGTQVNQQTFSAEPTGKHCGLFIHNHTATEFVFDWIRVLKLADPANFGVPQIITPQEVTEDITSIDCLTTNTESVAGSVSYSGDAKIVFKTKGLQQFIGKYEVDGKIRFKYQSSLL